MKKDKIVCKNPNKNVIYLDEKHVKHFEEMGIDFSKIDFNQVIKNYLNYLKENESRPFGFL